MGQRTVHLLILPVGKPNGNLFGTASWQQAGYTRVGHLGRLARGRPTDTAGCPRPGAQALSPGPGRRGACGAAPFRQALLQGIGGDSRTLRAELFCEGPGMAASRSSMRRAGDHSAPSLPWCAQRKRPSGGCAGAGTHLHRAAARDGSQFHLAPSPCPSPLLGRRRGCLWPAFRLFC